MYGIDAPELRQPYGKRAKSTLKRIIESQIVTLTAMKLDKYGRTVAISEVDGKIINLEMVRHGLAWKYDAYCRHTALCAEIGAVQERVRNMKSGLWRSKKPIEPWIYRKEKKNK